MATAIKKCRVCGKEYEACHTTKHISGVFRWREVACSPECGSIYLSRIEESRKIVADKPEVIDKKVAVDTITDYVEQFIDDEDEIDEEFDDEFDEDYDEAE